MQRFSAIFKKGQAEKQVPRERDFAPRRRKGREMRIAERRLNHLNEWKCSTLAVHVGMILMLTSVCERQILGSLH